MTKRGLARAAFLFVLLLVSSACSRGGGVQSLVEETPHARFYSPDGNAQRTVEELAAAFEAEYARVAGMFGYSSNEKTAVYVYTDKESFKTLIGRDTEGTYDASENAIKIYTPALLRTSEAREAYRDQLVHEFVHSVIQRINPSVGKLNGWMKGSLIMLPTS